MEVDDSRGRGCGVRWACRGPEFLVRRGRCRAFSTLGAWAMGSGERLRYGLGVAKGKESATDTVLRPDVELEDVLDQSALDEVHRKFDRAEAGAQARLAEESAWEKARTVDELRELAVEAGRGEQVSINKT